MHPDANTPFPRTLFALTAVLVAGAAFGPRTTEAATHLERSTWFHGAVSATVDAVVAAPDGGVYFAGWTQSPDLPATSGGLQPSIAPSGMEKDAYVCRLDADWVPVTCTYLGGSGHDAATDLAVLGDGRIVVVGDTSSTDFPTTADAFQSVVDQGASFGGGASLGDAFLVVLDAAASTMEYGTLLGGPGVEFVRSLAVDEGTGQAHLAGLTLLSGDDYPVLGELQPCQVGDSDATLASFDLDAHALVFSTCLGGSGTEEALGVAALPGGRVAVVGETSSADFPTLAPLQPSLGGPTDAFVAILDPAAGLLHRSTYWGGTGRDKASGAFADAAGELHVIGGTSSEDFPVVAPFLLPPAPMGPEGVGFYARFGAELHVVDRSSSLGRVGPYSLAVDDEGRVAITGAVRSAAEAPVIDGLPAHHPGGGVDLFAMGLAPGGTHREWSLVLGGAEGAGLRSNRDLARSVSLGPTGALLLGGWALSVDFPMVDPLPPEDAGDAPDSNDVGCNEVGLLVRLRHEVQTPAATREPSALDRRGWVEPLRLRVEAEGGGPPQLVVSWEAPPADAPGAAKAHVLHRGRLDSLTRGRRYDHAPVSGCDLSGPETRTSLLPENSYYLVSGLADGLAQSSFGRDSRGDERPTSGCP